MSSKFDLLLWGATGFTGQVAAAYLAKHYAPGKQVVSWAIGGRNQAKLEQLKAELIAIDPSCKEVGILIADIGRQEEVDRAVGSARVVLATAGPFTLCGTPIVDACVRLGVHYCDITGEAPWVASLVRKYHDQAASTKTFIIPFCGYDSIPSDIGTFMMVDYIRKNLNAEPQRVEYVPSAPGRRDRKGASAGMAGGTFRTVLNGLENPSPEALDPHLLTPADAPKPKSPGDFIFWGYNRHVGRWIGTFLMAPVNTRVVRRSAALLNYGSTFTYSEYMAFSGPIASTLTLLGVFFLVALLQIPFLRRYVASRLPPSGQGPDKEKLKNLCFRGVYSAQTIPKGKDKPITVLGKIESEGDPGYWETSKMLCESAICLATQMDEVLAQGAQGGVLTPASSMGGLLLERLRKAKMTFEVTKVVNPNA